MSKQNVTMVKKHYGHCKYNSLIKACVLVEKKPKTIQNTTKTFVVKKEIVICARVF